MLLICFAAMLLCLAVVGCEQVARKVIPKRTWHQMFNWKAEDFFSDPKVIALCKAIEANDVKEIDRLVAAGADVNAQGKGKMTPLMWAFFDNKPERFKRLLEHGANPNVPVESDFGTRSAIMAGETVTHMACKASFAGYFEAVFAHGGDPNLVQQTATLGRDDTPLFSLIAGSAPNKKEKVRLLIAKGANPNQIVNDVTPATFAVGGGQYDLALVILKAGGSHTIYRPRSNSRLIHSVIREERRSIAWSPQQRADYNQLLKWLVDQGESVELARADLARWKGWSHASGEYRRKMDAEVAEREEREKRQKAPAGDAGKVR